MVGYFNIKNLFYGFFYVVNPRVAKLNHFAIGENNVVVVAVKIRFFIVCLVLAKLVFAHQAAFQKQFNSIVKRGTAYAVVFVLHIYVQRLNIKMVVVVVNFLKNCVAFWRFAMPLLLKEARKNVLYNFLIIYVCF